MQVGSRGKICVSDHGDVKVHTYISPPDGLLTNTQIVEGPTKLIVFDGQFFLPYAEEAATYIEGLAKPVDRIVLSHIHLDHWSGLPVLAKRFPDAPICGLAGVGDYLRANGQRVLDARRPAFGDRIPSRPPVLTKILPEGEVSIDGVRFEFKRFIDAESALQLVALMPDQQTLLGFDLVFGPLTTYSPSRPISGIGSRSWRD
jgi:glyoxylase-like metal-dependent hydrolase (beta-lactamase superfamily II)